MEDWYNIVTSVDKSRIVLMIRKFHHVSDFQWRYILWMNECSTDKGARPELLVTLRALLLYHRNLVHIFAYNEWQKQKETIENSINMLKLYQSKRFQVTCVFSAKRSEIMSEYKSDTRAASEGSYCTLSSGSVLLYDWITQQHWI